MGVRRVIPLKVSGAFHSHLMKDAKLQFKEFVDTVDLRMRDSSNTKRFSRSETNSATSKETSLNKSLILYAL